MRAQEDEESVTHCKSDLQRHAAPCQSDNSRVPMEHEEGEKEGGRRKEEGGGRRGKEEEGGGGVHSFRNDLKTSVNQQ